MPLIQELYKIGAVQFGSFTLKSGIQSPLYLDLRLIVSYPELLRQVADKMLEKVSGGILQSSDVICGVPYTALPIATAISLKVNIPMVMRRKEVKGYGTKRVIEGCYRKGQSCLIIEDLVTSGLSVFETIYPLENEGLTVSDIIVLIDRQQGGKQNIESKGYRLHSVFTLSEILESLEHSGDLDPKNAQEIREFIQTHQTTGIL